MVLIAKKYWVGKVELRTRQYLNQGFVRNLWIGVGRRITELEEVNSLKKKGLVKLSLFFTNGPTREREFGVWRKVFRLYHSQKSLGWG